MSELNIGEYLIKLIKLGKTNKVIKILNANKNLDLNIRDKYGNYFLHYVVNFNAYKLLKFIFNKKDELNFKIRLDISDNHKRGLLYSCIKYGYNKLLSLLIQYNNTVIGIPILDLKDILGLTALHYACIHNNKYAFVKLLKHNANPYLQSHTDNIFYTAVKYKRYEYIYYLLKKKYTLYFVNKNNETLLQYSISIYSDNYNFIKFILKYTSNINNRNSVDRSTALHLSVINSILNVYKLLLSYSCLDINIADRFGNTCLHYICQGSKLEYLDYLLNTKLSDIKFNLANIDGNTPLHVFILNANNIHLKYLNILVQHTDLNIQNNCGKTCLMLIIKKNLVKHVYDTLLNKDLIVNIEDNCGDKIYITDEILKLLVDNKYEHIIKNESEYDWEHWCKSNKDKIISNIPSDIIKSFNIDFVKTTNILSNKLCKEKIKYDILHYKPQLDHTILPNIMFDEENTTQSIFLYFGLNIDIVLGLIYLYGIFKKMELYPILDYPLTIHNEITSYYQKLKLKNFLHIDFINNAILWSYQKLFFPTYFDNKVQILINIKKYLIIPILIDNSYERHANILFWDIKNKTIERFEPAGADYPFNYNYNPEYLDKLLAEKFKIFESNINYISAKEFLPNIGFSILESIEIHRRKLVDPIGFCWSWCMWWIYQRMSNLHINNTDLSVLLIKTIRLKNKSFKIMIRNFSSKYLNYRDSFLQTYNLDINLWINNMFPDKLIYTMENDMLKLLV